MSRDTDSAAIDSAMLRFRVLTAVVVAAIVLASEPQLGVLLAGLLVAAVISAAALMERPLRSQLGVAGVSYLSLAVDTIGVAVVLGLLGSQQHQSLALVALLPLVQGGLRHGLMGATAAWLVLATVAVVNAASSQTADLSGTAEFCALTLILALPIANLSDHLVDRVHDWADAHRGLERRTYYLADLVDAAGTLTTTDPAEVAKALEYSAANASGGQAKVVNYTNPHPEIDRAKLDAREAQIRRSETHTTVVIGLGDPTQPQALICRTVEDVDEVVTTALEVLVTQASLAMKTARAFQTASAEARRWSRLASTDPLTGLLNRRAIESVVASALASEATTMVAFIDLDGLKGINDTIGHEAGDALIAEAAWRLRTNLPNAPAARIGGDEFLVVAPASEADTIAFASAVRNAIHGDPVCHAGSEFEVLASIGVVAHGPGDIDTVESLIQRADQLMYEDKRVRKANHPLRRATA